jgi:dihydropyrimidinase
MSPADAAAMPLGTVIRGGTVVTADGIVHADVGISGEKIAAIGGDLRGGHVVDARGLVVVPGAIDVHTHFDTRIGGAVTADDYESGSRAAAAGGITTFVNFAFQERGQGLLQALDREERRARGRSHVDYSFHAVVTDTAGGQVLRELPGLAARGVTSLKLFTALGFELGRRDMLAVLDAAAAAGMLVAVHAEDGPVIDYLTARLIAQGRTGVRWLPEARPAGAEALAIRQVCAYAAVTGCPVYIVHLSSRAALDAVRQARAEGATVYAETRPAYLYLTSACYDQPAADASQYVCWPPLRSADDQQALWDGLASGEIQTYATDHTTWTRRQKLAPGGTFDKIPGGISSVQTSIGMLYAEGVAMNRITLQRFTEVCAANPARLFGLWPRKGTIAVGSDADLVLIDPGARVRIQQARAESRSDFEPYDGWERTGWPVLTLARGEVIYEQGTVTSKPGRGRLVHRSRVRKP